AKSGDCAMMLVCELSMLLNSLADIRRCCMKPGRVFRRSLPRLSAVPELSSLHRAKILSQNARQPHPAIVAASQPICSCSLPHSSRTRCCSSLITPISNYLSRLRGNGTPSHITRDFDSMQSVGNAEVAIALSAFNIYVIFRGFAEEGIEHSLR